VVAKQLVGPVDQVDAHPFIVALGLAERGPEPAA
jgi:hypothetical protein